MNTNTTTIVKKTMHLPKINFHNASNRKINAVNIDLELRVKETCAPHLSVDLTPCHSIVELAICGEIWNGNHTDTVCGGQCLDTIVEFKRSDNVLRIHEIWKQYHLNGMKAGTRAQSAILDAHKLANPDFRYDFTQCQNILRANDLLVDRGYSYGTAWLAEPLPPEIVGELCQLFTVPVADTVAMVEAATVTASV